MSLSQQAQESLLERLVLGLDCVDASAGRHDGADQLGDSFAIDATDEESTVRAVVQLAESGHRRARVARDPARAHAYRRRSQKLRQLALCHDLSAIHDGDGVADLLDLAE